MKKYANKAGNSKIKGYETLEKAIKIEYNDGSLYLYNYECNGKQHIDEMKALAENGIGLTSYIERYIRNNFAEKIR